MYDWDFSPFAPYSRAFVRGAWVTLKLAFLSSAIGTVVGIGLGAVLREKLVGRLLLPINDAVRAIPMLVLMFFVYYFPYGQVLGIRSPSEFTCAVAALAIAQAVYTADVFRAAVDGVSKGSLLGGRSVGLKEWDVWRFIVIPDVLRQILPTLVAFYIGTLRLSSIASVIGTQDVVFTARVAIGQRARSLEAWLLVSAIYVVIVLPLTWLGRRIERSRWLKRR